MTNARDKWYMIHAIGGGGRESWVSDIVSSCFHYVESEENISDIDFTEINKDEVLFNDSCLVELFVPTSKIISYKDGKKTTRSKKICPGYVFFHLISLCDLIDSDIESFIKKRVGNSTVLKRVIVSNISDSAVNKFKDTVNQSNDVGEISSHGFEIGENVKIIAGPFSNFVGAVSRVDLDKKELSVSVSVFGRETSVSIGMSDVNKVSGY